MWFLRDYVQTAVIIPRRSQTLYNSIIVNANILSIELSFSKLQSPHVLRGAAVSHFLPQFGPINYNNSHLASICASDHRTQLSQENSLHINAIDLCVGKPHTDTMCAYVGRCELSVDPALPRSQSEIGIHIRLRLAGGAHMRHMGFCAPG